MRHKQLFYRVLINGLLSSVSANPDWRVEPPPFPPPTLNLGGGGGPRQAPKGGALSHFLDPPRHPCTPWIPPAPPPSSATPWTNPYTPLPPPSNPAFAEFGLRCMRQQGQRLRACAYPASPLKLVLLTVLDLCLCLCLTRVSCCGHPSIH